MNKISTTHINSLDSESVSVPGLDVDLALEKTIALGQKKRRNKRIQNISTGLVTFSILSLFLIGFFAIFNDSTTRVSSKVLDSAQKQFEKVESTPQQTSATPAPKETVQSNQTSQVQNVIQPKLVSIKSFGNASLCNVNAGSINPGSGGVVIGPSTSVQTWSPGIGQTRIEQVPTSGRHLVLSNTAHNNATNGAFIDLVSGFDQANSYANITTLGFTYCEQGYKLEINPVTNSSNYSVSITSL